MFIQAPTVNTDGYMIAGYAIAFIVMGLYVLSMYLRHRNLNQDLSTLEEMERAAPPPPAAKPKPAQAGKTVTKKARQK